MATNKFTLREHKFTGNSKAQVVEKLLEALEIKQSALCKRELSG